MPYLMEFLNKEARKLRVSDIFLSCSFDNKLTGNEKGKYFPQSQNIF